MPIQQLPFRRRQFLIASSATSLLAACATDISRHVSDSVPELARSLGICAATFSIIKNGRVQPSKVVSGCSGGQSPQIDSVFQAASLTKPVIAYGALGLVLEKKLDLQSPVSNYLPHGYTHFSNVLKRRQGDPSDSVPKSILSRVTVGSLLNHTSGFPNWSRDSLTLDFDPCQRWQYSGEGYLILQSIIESVTGMDISEYVDKHVFKPFGMIDSSLVWKDSYVERAVSGTSRVGSKLEARFNNPVAAASLYTTAGDYARFLSAFLAQENYLSLTLSKPVSVDRALNLSWGYGWGIEVGDNGPNLWQWGNNSGFRAFAMVSPVTKDGFVIFTNNERGMALAVPLAQQVIPMKHNAFKFGMVS
jgi:CubicO group peptidase (beta-lactamase class C family)